MTGLSKIPALSIRQPWATLIAHGFKDVENRTWSTDYRGPILIHAGKSNKKDERGDAIAFISRAAVPDAALTAAFNVHEFGGIVGMAEIVDCVTHSDSPWFVGDFGFVIKNAKPLPFIPCRGMLGFFYPRFEEDAK